MKDPLVSIIMPVFNAEEYLPNAIESILWQTYQNWELIAIDDGSEDASFQILKSYALKDKRIKIFANSKNHGIGHTMNFGLSKALGEYIARQDADDISLPTRLEKQIQFLLQKPDVGIVGGFMAELNNKRLSAKRTVPLEHTEIKKGMFINQSIQNPTLMLKRDNIPAVQFWYDGCLSPVDELDFFFRMLKDVKFANIAEYVVVYRRHQHNSSLKNIKRTFALTFFTRIRAILHYQYKPTMKSFLVHWIQSLVVCLLPNSILYKIFQIWKHSKLEEIDVENILFDPHQLENKIQMFLSAPSVSLKQRISYMLSYLSNTLWVKKYSKTFIS